MDFIVIGAQKAGTTSLWQYLRSHRRVILPDSKELPIFSARSAPPAGLDRKLHGLFPDGPSDSLRGKVTPDYMVGEEGTPTAVVAERIAAAAPRVKLIAILRDPIERAISSYAMAVRREQESRPVDAALDDLLGSEQLIASRLKPSPVNSYLVAGEYGRILGEYRRNFRESQMLVLFTEDLARDPGAVLDSVLTFLGLPGGFRPGGLGVRHFRGGTKKLVDSEAETLLFDFYREQILPQMRGPAAGHRKAFEFFYETWNVAVDEKPSEISAGLRARLQLHFRDDAEELAALGVRTPWIDRWVEESDEDEHGRRC